MPQPITFRVESWFDVKQEAVPLWRLHWEEVGRDKGHMPLDVDVETLDRIASFGRMHIVTVRRGVELVGYHASIIETLPSYKSVLCAQGHVHWIAKSVRGARVALRLLQEVEHTCRARGVQLLNDRTKLFASQQRLFEKMGYRPTDLIMTKWIG